MMHLLDLFGEEEDWHMGSRKGRALGSECVEGDSQASIEGSTIDKSHGVGI